LLFNEDLTANVGSSCGISYEPILDPFKVLRLPRTLILVRVFVCYVSWKNHLLYLNCWKQNVACQCTIFLTSRCLKLVSSESKWCSCTGWPG
jgi:hypothetical protein